MGSPEDRELRDALERVQQENKELRLQLAELSAIDVAGYEARIEELEHDNAVLRQRLDQADRVREKWDARVRRLKLELDIAQKEQERLRTVLDNERLSRR